jgi:peptide alpha-N-acetyltransferase
MQDLVDMQCIWFALESAEAQTRLVRPPAALLRYNQIRKHYEDMTDDQFDFHTYCLRKMTLRSYIDLIRHEDGLYGTEWYRRATVGAVECYLRVFDGEETVDENDKANIVSSPNMLSRATVIDDVDTCRRVIFWKRP